MEKNNMTAVEWLVRIVQSCIAPDYIPKEIIQQALAMEREQHGKTWDDALVQVEKRTVWARAMCDFDEYYEETYKK